MSPVTWLGSGRVCLSLSSQQRWTPPTPVLGVLAARSSQVRRAPRHRRTEEGPKLECERFPRGARRREPPGLITGIVWGVAFERGRAGQVWPGQRRSGWPGWKGSCVGVEAAAVARPLAQPVTILLGAEWLGISGEVGDFGGRCGWKGRPGA